MALNDEQRRVIAAIDGPQPGGEQQGVAQGGGQQPGGQQQGARQPERNTSEGKAQEKGSPKSESAQMAENPFIEIDMGNGQKRQMTSEQIRGMATRYSALNHRHAQLKPIMDLIDNYTKDNPDASPQQMAEMVAEMMAAGQHNPTFGKGGAYDGGKVEGQNGRKQGQEQGGRGNGLPSDDEFQRWESDNATSLPPGYRQMHETMQGMMSSMMQQTQMMERLIAASSGTVDAARSAHQGAAATQGDAIKRSIANNLDAAQQRLQLPTDAADDFMMFAQQRGYSLEDFVDGNLTVMVMQDFANSRNSPEMQRLREIHQRRSSFIPAGGGAPAGGGSQMSPEERDFSEFAGRLVEKRRL